MKDTTLPKQNPEMGDDGVTPPPQDLVNAKIFKYQIR